MLLMRTDSLPWGEQWLCELKLDGYRAVAFKRICGRGTTNDVNARYPAVVEALAKLPDYGGIGAGRVLRVRRDGARGPECNARATAEALLMSKGEKMHRRLLPGCRPSVSALSKPLRT
jgi:hypothetical protein